MTGLKYNVVHVDYFLSFLPILVPREDFEENITPDSILNQ